MFRTTFEKTPPIEIKYRSLKHLDSKKVVDDLIDHTSDINNYGDFEKCLVSILDSHAPMKSKKLRANTKPFINKSIRKAIAIRTRLKNIANKTGLLSDFEKYKRQRNFVVAQNKKAQKSYFKQLNPKNIQTSKTFFQTFKPYFSNKYTHAEKLILVENKDIISNDLDIAECFNGYFANITKSLDIKEWPINYSAEGITDPCSKALNKFSNHPSIQAINAKIDICPTLFKFRKISKAELKIEIESLDSSKSGSVPIQFIKAYLPFYIDALCISFDNAIQ